MTCEGCKYWSELMAEVDATTGFVQAVCLHPTVTADGKVRWVRRGCEMYDPGTPVDIAHYNEIRRTQER